MKPYYRLQQNGGNLKVLVVDTLYAFVLHCIYGQKHTTQADQRPVFRRNEALTRIVDERHGSHINSRCNPSFGESGSRAAKPEVTPYFRGRAVPLTLPNPAR